MELKCFKVPQELEKYINKLGCILQITEGRQDLQEVGEVRERLVLRESKINFHQYTWVPHAELGWNQGNPSR